MTNSYPFPSTQQNNVKRDLGNSSSLRPRRDLNNKVLTVMLFIFTELLWEVVPLWHL